MNTYILTHKGEKPIKNLGWLLRHWQQVEQIGFNFCPNKFSAVGGQLVGYLKNKDKYFTEFASLSIAWNWLDRPVFRGLPFILVYDNFNKRKEFIIGDEQWKQINKMEYNKQMETLLQ